MDFVNSKDTSLITILSSEHGRLRREQRDIDKRDLQKALKYGSFEPCWGHRWRVEFDGIVFITDRFKRREITAFPAPLPKMPVDSTMTNEHENAKLLLHLKPELSTSHTVFVIDNSGSMLAKKNDIHLYRDSQNASISMTALEFVAEQLINQTAVNSDLVSLVTFSDRAVVAMEREPLGWPVYNKILSHRNVQRHVERMYSPYHDKLCSESNYLPALDTASTLLENSYHEKCALSLFFFSDGQSTDHSNLKIDGFEAMRKIREKIAAMASRYGDALTVTILGLGNQSDDFSVLELMASSAKDAGAKASFELCYKTANSICSAISSMVSSTTETRTALLEGRRRGFTTREDLKAETDAAIKFDWQYYWIADHQLYDPKTQGFRRSPLIPLAAAQSNPREAARRAYEPPPYLAINRHFLGKGAERVAFRCRLSDSELVSGFAFDAMVAKETKDVERLDEEIEFHREFMHAQQLADYLAQEFNKRLHGLPMHNPLKTPRINFLNCSILVVDDPTRQTGKRGVLVEKLLDTALFQWTKWNDNNGMVDGKHKHIALDVNFELRQCQKEKIKIASLGAVTEADEEEDSDDDESVSDVDSNGDEAREEPMSSRINPSDYLQAYTHFTYRYTNKKVMVCDLQGVFNTEMTPPTFELTDPAIHYASTKGRRMVFGRTDKGQTGMKSFFKTHKCTDICKYLQLSAKNKTWKRHWRQEFRMGGVSCSVDSILAGPTRGDRD